MNATATHRLLAIATDPLVGSEPIEEIRRQADGGGVEVRLVFPAVESNSFRHAFGDVDAPMREAEEQLRVSLQALDRAGLKASGSVGDSDPVQAAQDALLETPADEVLIFEHPSGQARWFENGLFEKAQESLEPPLRMVVINPAADGTHVVEVEQAPPGRQHLSEEKELESAYIPGFSRADFAGMAIGIVGTIIVIVLAAAAAASGSGPPVGWKAVAIGIAIGIGLINMAHVVGLTLFESVHYRGGFAKFFRRLSMIATPAAILVNLLILLFA
ncbi:MAG TPA: hypothetical protein VFI03_10135 [Solirubrobacterales bacterium]|nr:hypothetical protein [Solirubrobacterales bacterium]